MTEDLNTMSLDEFVQSGYLQEVNRKFFHPMGIALSVIQNADGKVEGFGPIWDYRNEPTGIRFAVIDEDMKIKAHNIEAQRKKSAKERFQQLGYIIQFLEG